VDHDLASLDVEVVAPDAAQLTGPAADVDEEDQESAELRTVFAERSERRVGERIDLRLSERL
jgi:hypothetical protein